MARKCLIVILRIFFRFIFWFRYRVTVKGLEKLSPELLNKPGGVLFLPNHPGVFVEPTLVALFAWKKYPIRPMIVDHFYHQPIVRQLMDFIDALPIPSFDSSANSIKKKRNEEVISTIIDGLQKRNNFLVYPAGRTKSQCQEFIGASSATHRIINGAKEANIVLVRTKGIWGSSFSRALTGKAPPIFPTLFQNVKYILKNGLFFMPRRRVIIEFEPVPHDFPYHASRMELNRWLENWYNQPDGLTKQEGEFPGDSLMLVSYSLWKKELATPYTPTSEDAEIDIGKISDEVIKKIYGEISRITTLQIEKITPEMRLDSDLGMDSIDRADLSLFIQEHFFVKSISPLKMNSVAKALAIADKQIVCCDDNVESSSVDLSVWNRPIERERRMIAEGKIVPEVFLNSCRIRGKRAACYDERSGVLTYKELKLRVILLAEYIRTLPGKHIGVLLPSSVAAYIVILAIQMAGKVPTLVNWTMGSRHLKAVRELSDIGVVLTSRAFIDKLQNVDLEGIDDILFMLEDLRTKISLKDKLLAFLRSLRSTAGVMKSFGLDKANEEMEAVLLFTSGTESMPKGVPLSHKNILGNLRQALNTVMVYSDDVFFGILPPFHAFGFTISGLMGILSGIRIVYSPDPTDGKKIASIVKEWKVSVTCGAPTFLKAMFRSGKLGDFDSLRLCVTGAEKSPPELFRLAEKMGVGNTLYEGYGITECSPVITMNVPGKEQLGVGEPVKGVELKIVNPETMAPVEMMGRGLVLVRGDNIFSGYLNSDVSSPFVTIDGKKWFKTGDLGHIDEHNRLIISGRQKRFVKVGGEMVSLAAIEDALLQMAPKMGWLLSDEGASLAVSAKEDASTKTRIFLFTVFDTTTEEVNKALREAGFSSLVKVSAIFQVPAIPLMGSGKIFYRELEGAYL